MLLSIPLNKNICSAPVFAINVNIIVISWYVPVPNMYLSELVSQANSVPPSFETAPISLLKIAFSACAHEPSGLSSFVPTRGLKGNKEKLVELLRTDDLAYLKFKKK